MLRANLVAPMDFQLEEVPVPKIRPDHILIRVKTCGICGSDLHSYHGKHPYISCPIVPGHEFSGIAEEVGPEAHGDWKRGDRVTAVPSLTCGNCSPCRQGRSNICETLKVIGCQIDGAFAEFLTVPAEKVVKLDDRLSFEEGAMLEPLAVGVHSMVRADVKAGQCALILGAGTIGLMVLQVAQCRGVRTIVADVLEGRLEFARRLGADFTVNLAQADLEETVRQSTPDGPDVIVECVGIAETLQNAVRMARKGTRIVVVGVFGEDVLLPVGLIQDRELELLGDSMYMKPDFILAQELVGDGKAQLKPILSRIFRLEQVTEAFSYLEQNQDVAVKVLLRIA